MEYVYAALILHESGTEITEDKLTTVLEAAAVDVNESRVKALVAALEDVDIEEALEQSTAVAAGAPATGPPEEAEEAEAEDEQPEEEEEPEDEEDTSGEGLGSLFG